ncbi:MAG TPA: DEAD/DEAH box helicase [Planctomycetaceae bacterium]|nr:DEAD/DEAH box helicase [Planctomycetaceae bacterium]
MSSSPAVAFSDLGLSERSLQRLRTVGFESPSPIQAAFIPIALKGDDCTGQARTGTGKTAAFVLPILERLDPNDTRTQALVLCPTRELSEQVATECHRLAANHEYRTAVFVGGRPLKPQLNDLRKGVEIAIGTPGRVIDLIERRALNLDSVKIAVLDEADRMLDIGFRPDIEKILRRCPTERQTLLLSATMPPPVERLAKRYMRDPKRVDLSEDTIVVDTIDQYYMTVDEDRKFGVLVRILAAERPQQALVFTRTKRGAERLYRRFAGKLPGVAMMNGDLPQTKRDQVMARFRAGKIRLLVATDVVGRGIDVRGISHIVNYDVPEYCDDYIHRVGRTGRLSSKEKGWAITFVTREQGDQLTEIEKRINVMLPEYKLEDFEAFRPRSPRPTVEEAAADAAAKKPADEPELNFSVA